MLGPPMPLAVKRMTELPLKDKRVLIREDLNVPIKDGRVTSTARIEAALPTLRLALDAGARVLVMSHLGRPKEGKFDPAASLAPVAAKLGELLGRDMPLARDWLDGVDVAPGNSCSARTFVSTWAKRPTMKLAKSMAALCDVFVMDAFGTAHRAQASTNGVARYAPVACAGPLLVAELEALAAALESPKRPLLAIVGGSKVSTKLEVLQSLSAKVDELILGGGIANTIPRRVRRRGRQVVVRGRHGRLREASSSTANSARPRFRCRSTSSSLRAWTRACAARSKAFARWRATS